jgi:3-deoxy-manno-octulosonate cytidylyltransferase (CMP-KDO synthetase)
MKYAIIIPARSGSKRLPNKPLLDVCGKSLVQRTYEQAQRTLAYDVCVAATSNIMFHLIEDQVKVTKTSDKHTTGTHRCAEAARNVLEDDVDVVINWQGDEPLMNPAHIDRLAHLAEEKGIATITASLDLKDRRNQNVVKVTVSDENYCTWFGRDYVVDSMAHVGIYAFRRGVLEKLGCLKPTPFSKFVSLEQTAWMEYGYSIAALKIENAPLSINTQEDLEKYREIIREES